MKNTTADSNTASSLARSNKTVILAHFIDVLVMFIFCALQTLSGLQTWSYVLVIALLGFIPVALEHHFWKKTPETPVVKYLTAIGFGIFYTFALFTSTNQLVFVFVVPMILIVSVYNDVRYSLLINIVTVLESLILVIIGSINGSFGYLGRDYGIIQIVFMILVGIYSMFTTKTIKSNFYQVLSNLSEVTEEMKSGIQDIDAELEKLNEASSSTINAMQEVSTGTNDTAEAVQKQLLQTQEIQNKVTLVSDSTSQITDFMQKTLAALETGNQNVDLLVQKVDISVQNGEDVADKLKILEQSVTEMNSIVEFISSIARQTGLLALNARIEASHAGSFGKGFAVVASEISDMATQIKEATTHITELIENTASGINEVVTGIHQMIAGIQEEKLSTDSTSDSFSSIQTSTLSIRDNIEILAGHIGELKDANRAIMDSIETISAVSEEVSAHAAETTTAEEGNATILTRIDERMQALLELTQ